MGAGSDADTENEVMSPEHAMRLWGRGVKTGRSSCLSSRSNSALTLTDTEHENKSDSENGESLSPFLLLSQLCSSTHFIGRESKHFVMTTNQYLTWNSYAIHGTFMMLNNNLL